MTRRRIDPDLPPGIFRVHDAGCDAFESRAYECCTCRPRYQAQAGPKRSRKTKTLATLTDAKRWKRRVEERAGGDDRIPRLSEAADRWLAAAESGQAVTRSSKPYRSDVVAGYRLCLERYVLPELGRRRLDTITRGDVLALIGSLQQQGLSPSTVRNAIVPLRSLYRFANDHRLVTDNPTRGVVMPGVSAARRDRYAEPPEIAELLAALQGADRVLWATAAYAGLRRGELAGLRRRDVDLEAGQLRVAQAWSYRAGAARSPKSEAGRRAVPIPDALLNELRPHLADVSDDQLVFARSHWPMRGSDDPDAPFSYFAVRRRAGDAWKAAGLEPIGFHECRHACASNYLAAGVPMQVVQAIMGHSSITTTVNSYGHLRSTAVDDARADLNRFLDGRSDPVVPAEPGATSAAPSLDFERTTQAHQGARLRPRPRPAAARRHHDRS